MVGAVHLLEFRDMTAGAVFGCDDDGDQLPLVPEPILIRAICLVTIQAIHPSLPMLALVPFLIQPGAYAFDGTTRIPGLGDRPNPCRRCRQGAQLRHRRRRKSASVHPLATGLKAVPSRKTNTALIAKPRLTLFQGRSLTFLIGAPLEKRGGLPACRRPLDARTSPDVFLSAWRGFCWKPRYRHRSMFVYFIHALF